MDHEVEEIRKRRRRLLREEYGGSVHALIEGAVAWQERHPERVKRLRKGTRRAVVTV